MTFIYKNRIFLTVIAIALNALITTAKADTIKIGLWSDSIHLNYQVPFKKVDLNSSYGISYHKKNSLEANIDILTQGGSMFGFLMSSGVGVQLNYLKKLNQTPKEDNIMFGLVAYADVPLSAEIPVSIETKAVIFPSILAFTKPDIKFGFKTDFRLKYSVSNQANVFIGYRLHGLVYDTDEDFKPYQNTVTIGIEMSY